MYPTKRFFLPKEKTSANVSSNTACNKTIYRIESFFSALTVPKQIRLITTSKCIPDSPLKYVGNPFVLFNGIYKRAYAFHRDILQCGCSPPLKSLTFDFRPIRTNRPPDAIKLPALQCRQITYVGHDRKSEFGGDGVGKNRYKYVYVLSSRFAL